MDITEQIEEIEKIINEAKELNITTPIIVEGSKDKIALKILGFEGKIIKINQGKSIFTFCEELAKNFKEVIILTDWDNRGGRLCRMLKKDLTANSIKHNEDIRARLLFYCKKEAKDVEGIVPMLENMKRKAAEKPSD
ncbi:MAG: toprim domain-containing protein [Thermoplasmata archaeon]